MQIPFVGFLPIRSSEHMSALGVLFMIFELYSSCRWFGFQIVGFVNFAQQLPSRQFQTLLRALVLVIFAGRLRRPSTAYRFWSHCSLDRPFLLPLGYRIRQDSYSHHCFRLRASANCLASLLLRSEHDDLALPCRCLHVLPHFDR